MGEQKDKMEEIETIFKKAFNYFDKNCEGLIATEDLGTLMHSLGYNPTKEELEELIKLYDKDESGTIDQGEFLDLMNYKLKVQQEGEQLFNLFNFFDIDGDGFISAEDIRFILNWVDVQIDDKLIDQLIEQSDLNSDGKINYFEFSRLMTFK